MTGSGRRTAAARVLRRPDPQSVTSGPRGVVLASLATAANVHDTRAAGTPLDRAAQESWHLERIKVDGIHVGPRMNGSESGSAL